MSDRNLKNFQGRVQKLERSHAQGYGFEAPGTLGRNAGFRAGRRRRSLLAPLVVVLACAFGSKATIFYYIGGGIYQTRVERLQAGDTVAKVGGWLMQADPVTRYLAEKLGLGLALLD